MSAASTSASARAACASKRSQTRATATNQKFAPPQKRNSRALVRRRARENYHGESEALAQKSKATYDKLVDVFDGREEKDWIALLAFSGKWLDLRGGVFERCAERARESEDPDDEMRLSALRRKLMALDERVDAYARTLEEIREREKDMWEGFVATRRREFTVEFFTWLRFKLEAVAQGEDDNAKEELTKEAALLLSLCETYDEASKDQQVIEQATQTLQDILQADSLDAMDAKIDELAMANQITPALVLTASKAYMSVKESQYTKDEIKDVMAHLYFKMKDTTARQQPKEVRILKYILSMEDPIDQRNALEEAFTPGPELEEVGANTDLLWCEPKDLLALIDVIVDNFYQSAGKKNLRGDAAAMMSPALVERMKALKQIILAHFSE
ncbi:Folate receptor-like [Ostreococcus tauri]|uniref:Folate receptor-like n=1 Tax=Ostreococcus tauri TaxID=70448 RepID=Q015G1_OSTTA|nr:Folate receptor-like [Ostreococcus tauri]CAL54468.1 Folate receptor-like [Ostreococcus tauri]|eukprot:XP_003080301.1 Folate receptor-like [Ostreococcus tauri]